jgi:hypothetical protein
MIAPPMERGKSASLLYREERSLFTIYGCGLAALRFIRGSKSIENPEKIDPAGGRPEF